MLKNTNEKKNILLVSVFGSVGTVISTINSAISLSRYDKNNDVRIINVCGN